jgi:uncharacterized membrane protein YfcA
MTGRRGVETLVAGFVAGLAGGLFGVGGGIVLIPILTSRFKLTQHQAHGTSLAVIGATALASIVVYGLHSNVRWTIAAIVALASMITARYGARLAKRTSARGLAQVFAGFLVLVALRMLWKTPAPAVSPVTQGVSGVAFDLVLGSAVGVLSGYMGVGGGILAVPAFTLLAGMSQQAAQGTSLAVILVAAPAGAFEHARHGNVVGRLVPWLAVGAALGGPLASALAQEIPHEALARAFAVFLLINAVHIWRRAGAASQRNAVERAPLD